MKRLKLRFPVFVEGNYDKKRICAVAEGTIITGNGFGVFNSNEKIQLLKKITDNGKLIILTDSDKAGIFIRNKLKGYLNTENIINLYTPSVQGKEKRKKTPSKDGLIGVEGMENHVIFDLLLPYSTDVETTTIEEICTADLYNRGLVGTDGSAALRKEFCDAAGLPKSLTPKALKEAINILGGKRYFLEILEKI